VDTPITASVQPASGAELRLLGEGYVNRKVLFAFTTTDLLTQAGVGGLPDKVIYRGESFAVLRVLDRSDLGNFYRATLVKDLA
ncbi:MAG: hypothetical protein ACYC6M_11770, partial [Terriglobales bacterium]